MAKQANKMNFILKRMFLTIYIFSIFLFSYADGISQDIKKVGTSAATFLRIPVGSRGTAMGSAFASVASDVTAMFWNPGGLAKVSNYSLLVDHSPWLPGLDFNYFGLALPFGRWGIVGMNITSLTTEQMEITTPQDPMGTGETFTASSMAVGLCYARYLTDRFSIGANVKYIHESIYHCSASGFAFDIGTLYITPFDDIRLGVSVSNVGTKMQMTGEDLNVNVDIAPQQEGNNQSVVGRLKTEKFDLPIIMRVGLSWDAWQTKGSCFTIAADAINPNDNALSVNIGVEYALINQMLILRGGYNELFLAFREKGLALGAGLNFILKNDLGITMDYAYQDFIHLGGVNRISLAIYF